LNTCFIFVALFGLYFWVLKNEVAHNHRTEKLRTRTKSRTKINHLRSSHSSLNSVLLMLSLFLPVNM